MKPVAWSYSRLTGFEDCPRRFWHLNVKKDLKEPETQAMADGQALHKAFELRLRDAKPLPIHLRVHEPVLDMINKSAGDKIVEQQIALNAQWQPVEWFDKDTWLRVKSDLTQYKGNYGVVWDWKTGRPHEDYTQLELNAAVLLHLAPEIDRVATAYYWTKTRKVASGDTVSRDRVSEIWGPILARVQKYQEAHEQELFPPKEHPYFCKGCPVTTCQFWKPRKS